MKEKKNKCERNACAVKTSIGGQALMEGIMMRGPHKTALAVRNPKGEIVVEEFTTKGVDRPKICRLPVIRGIFAYIDSMTVGYRCLMRSAEISGLEDLVEEKPKKKKKAKAEKEASSATAETRKGATEETVEATAETGTDATIIESAVPSDRNADQVEADADKKEGNADKKEGNAEKEESKLPAWVMTLVTVGSVVLALAIAIVLFVYLPAKLYGLLIAPNIHIESPALNSLLKSVFEGVLKIALLVGYMGAISLMKDIRRTFMYHGAEHKTIFCYEAGLDLTVENVRKMRRFHPRCGTSFLILMLLVSIFISFFIDPIAIAVWGSELVLPLRVAVKLLLIPLIVGLGYELIKFAGRHDNLLTRIISAPGMWLQRITVFEPTDDMIECAIRSVEEVIPHDGSDQW